ncbi:MAG: hypothetical protein RPT00_02645 [Gammaproteobacteria bacterium]
MNFTKIAKAKLWNGYIGVKDILVNDQTLGLNKKLQNIHIGNRIFILGSGASIKLYDLTQLKHEYVMTQNNFHVHPDIKEINPNYHCVVPYYQSNKEFSIWQEWISDMVEKLPNAQFCWGKNTKHLIDSNFSELKEKSYYISAKYRVLTLSKAKVDMTKTIMEINTVTTQCLILALYMGFSEIYLLGFDHNQLCGDRLKQNRFYGMSKITDTEAEAKLLDKQRGVNILQSYINTWKTQKQLGFLRSYSERNGIKIRNVSNEGILEIFERLPLREVVGNNMLLKK